MTVRSRIVESAAGLLAQSADVDVSTRAICDAAGVTAPTLYHHFGDKDGLLAAVVDFGWVAFMETKLAAAAVVHNHVADDIRAGWDNHLEFARGPEFLQADVVAFGRRQQLGGARGVPDALRPAGAGRRARPAAPVGGGCVAHCPVRDHGAALSLISQPDLYGDGAFATQLREAVIAWITVPQGTPSSTHGPEREAEATIASAAATLSSRLTAEDTPLTGPEMALMRQWLTTLADAPAGTRPGGAAPGRGS